MSSTPEGPAETASPWIIEPTDATFEADVIGRSHELPVVVDFWSATCPPCRILGPIIERLTREAAGAFLLAKVNVEQAPGAAMAFGIQSIPTVVALRNGQVVDHFVGAMPEAELRTWLGRIQPSPAEVLVVEARDLEVRDPAAAEAKYREAAELDPQQPAAKIGLARLLARGGDVQGSKAILDELSARGFLEKEAEAVQAEVQLAQSAGAAGSVEEARRAAEAAPDDLALQLKLADALAGAGDYEAALETCLAVVQRDRQTYGEPARERMVNMFLVLGADSELSSTYRRKLSAALY